MLYIFKSRETADLIMLEPNARRILEIIGKDTGPKGIILPEQMPAAIKALEAAIALEQSGDKKVAGVVPGDGLGLHQRAMPFIDMLQHNYTSGDEVVWGV